MPKNFRHTRNIENGNLTILATASLKQEAKWTTLCLKNLRAGQHGACA